MAIVLNVEMILTVKNKVYDQHDYHRIRSLYIVTKCNLLHLIVPPPPIPNRDNFGQCCKRRTLLALRSVAMCQYCQSGYIDISVRV